MTSLPHPDILRRNFVSASSICIASTALFPSAIFSATSNSETPIVSRFSPGYYITAELRVKDKSWIAEARVALSILCSETLKEPGCSIFQLHQDTIEPSRFLLWERFDNEAAFKLHFEEPHTKAYVALGLTEVVQYFQTNVVAA